MQPEPVTPLRTRLNIHLYSILWNEAPMLGFFFRHYDPWISRYVMLDDGSTDGTLDILRQHPRVEVRRFERGDEPRFVPASKRVYDRVWKESRGKADWVVITAVDEHLHHSDLIPWLEARHDAGTTLIPALGYQMVSEAFPEGDETLALTLTQGAPFVLMSKLSLFRPDALTDTFFDGGRHSARPQGRLVLPERDELMLLHYRYIGRSRLKERDAELAARAGEADRDARWATHYSKPAEEKDREFRRILREAVDISRPTLRPWETHPAPRWWRA
jgi:glycosyltransferase involved in cell wall biosynthesis